MRPYKTRIRNSCPRTNIAKHAKGSKHAKITNKSLRSPRIFAVSAFSVRFLAVDPCLATPQNAYPNFVPADKNRKARKGLKARKDNK